MKLAKKNHHPGGVRCRHLNLPGLDACFWLAACGLYGRYSTSNWPIKARGFLTNSAHCRLQVRAEAQLRCPPFQGVIGLEDRFVMRGERTNRLSSSCSAQDWPEIKKKAAAPGKTGRLPSSPTQPSSSLSLKWEQL